MSQELTGEQLLENAIAYHDPHSNWTTFQGKLHITMSTPDGKERQSAVHIDLPKEYFQLISVKENIQLERTLDKETCTLKLNGKTSLSEEETKKHRLTCEGAYRSKNYYTYLNGLPMKLKDVGTIIHPATEKKVFKGKTYLVLKVSYEEEIGTDVWYFYLDQETYALQLYQFFHDESKNDGAYALLSGEEEISGIKMPKTRAWYNNKDDAYLGTDLLTKTADPK